MAEPVAIRNAILKPMALGERWGYPHSSAVRSSSEAVRELRPRAGRWPWRAFYRRVGTDFFIAAISLAAQADARGFSKAVATAEARLADWEEDNDG